MPQPAAPVAVFCSFAPEDEPLCLDLERRLKPLHRQGLLTLWHRGHILTGTDRTSALAAALSRAALILLLISPDYLSCDDCFEVELAHRNSWCMDDFVSFSVDAPVSQFFPDRAELSYLFSAQAHTFAEEDPIGDVEDGRDVACTQEPIEFVSIELIGSP